MSETPDTVVIFTGRGGSGTRLLSQLAGALGVFIGNHLNKSGDSIEWVDLVYRMAVEAGRSQALPSGSGYRRELRARAQQILRVRRDRAASPWGLKLPETMLVLPLLVDAFPRAKLVHLIRHPISSSLRRTHLTSRLNNAVGAATLPNAYRYCQREVGAIAGDEPYLHNACSWNYQVSRIVDYGRSAVEHDQYLEVRYEDLCAAPESIMTRARSFLGVEACEGAAPITVDPARTNRWNPSDPRVETIWNLCGRTATRLGYSPDNDRTSQAASA